MISALGFAPHSGWAAVVGLGATGAELHVLVRERVPMADPNDPGSRQPYHAVEGLPVGEAEGRLTVYQRTAASMAFEAIQGIADRLRGGGHRVVGVGLLESSGRKGASLAATLASHALIHTADGNHFRDAIAGAAERAGLVTSRVRARDLGAEAAAAIGRPATVLRQSVHDLGREVGPPWGADQKGAALLAWLVLRRHA